MEWNGISQAASFQQGPWSNWAHQYTLRACKPDSNLQSRHCKALLSECVSSFHDTLTRQFLSPEAHPLDAIILAIDIEDVRFPQPPKRIGIATLDTRVFFDPSIPPSQKIHTNLFHRTTWEQVLRWRHGTARRPTYLFSQHERVWKGTVLDSLKSSFTHEGRNVILIGHETQSELYELARLRFRPDQYASISGVLCTRTIAGDVFQREKDTTQRLEEAGLHYDYMSLGNLLKELGFEGKEFHDAGNDANFTLRALLLLMARELDGDRARWTNDTGAKVEMLRTIAMDPLPSGERNPRTPRLDFKGTDIAEMNRKKKDAVRSAAKWDEMDLADALGQLET